MNRGEVDFASVTDRQSFLALTAASTVEPVANLPKDSGGATEKRLFDQGLRATAWGAHRKPWGKTVAFAVRRVPSLQTTNSALMTLLAGNILLALIGSLSTMQIKTLAFQIGRASCRERVCYPV